MSGWVGVDLDRTLAHYESFEGPFVIGAPIPKMVARVKQLIQDGYTVKIFTARIADDPHGMVALAIQDWCQEHIGQRLEVTNVKDHAMWKLYDDRAVQVEPNTGELLGREI